VWPTRDAGVKESADSATLCYYAGCRALYEIDKNHVSSQYASGPITGFASRLSHVLAQLNTLIGSVVAWLCVAMVLATATVVILRYGFGIGSIPLQESVTYMHCAVFMLGAAMTLERGGHVRVDIFYQHWSVRRRAVVDLIGAVLLLMPFAIFMITSSLDYVEASWRIKERSPEADGLPYIWMLKTLIPTLGVMLILQAISGCIRNILLLLGYPEVGDPASMPADEKI